VHVSLWDVSFAAAAPRADRSMFAINCEWF
jgi:hypothetical protein